MDGEYQPDGNRTHTVNGKWKAAALGIVVILVGVLVFRLLRQPSSQAEVEPGPGSSPVEAPVASQTTATSSQPELSPAEAKFEQANIHYEAGQWELAAANYQQAIELDPNYQAAYANLGVTYYQQQQYDLAALQYQKALELDPQDADVAYNLGALYLQQALSQAEGPDHGLVDRAIEQLKAAQLLSPDLAEPHFTLGVAYMILEQKEAAIQAFETFLTLSSEQDSQARQEAERYIQSLTSP